MATSVDVKALVKEPIANLVSDVTGRDLFVLVNPYPLVSTTLPFFTTAKVRAGDE